MKTEIINILNERFTQNLFGEIICTIIIIIILVLGVFFTNLILKKNNNFKVGNHQKFIYTLITAVSIIIINTCLSLSIFYLLDYFCPTTGNILNYKYINSNEFRINNSAYIQLIQDINNYNKNEAYSKNINLIDCNGEIIKEDILINTKYLKDNANLGNNNIKVVIDDFITTPSDKKTISYDKTVHVVKEIK